MVGRDIVKMLEYEAKRRPEIAEMIENVRVLDIEQAIVPMPWFKQALAIMQARIVERDRLALAEWRLRDAIIYGTNPDPMGEIREWIGVSGFIKFDRGIEHLVETGNLIWIDDRGGMDLRHIHSEMVPDIVYRESRVIAKATKLEYRSRLDEISQQLPGDSPDVPSHRPPNGMFTITRMT